MGNREWEIEIGKRQNGGKVSKEVLPNSCESPSEQDVQFLSDDYDDLLKSKEEISRKLQRFKSSLKSVESKLNNIAKAKSTTS